MSDRTWECVCQAVVTRVYHEIRKRRVAETVAFETAATVYQYYHPDVPDREARFAIAEWLDTDTPV